MKEDKDKENNIFFETSARTMKIGKRIKNTNSLSMFIVVKENHNIVKTYNREGQR